VTFAGNTGTLELDQPQSFTGTIAGLTETTVLDFAGFNAATTTGTTGPGSYDSATGITALTVNDSSDNNSVTLNLEGDYSNSSWTVTSDGNGGANIVDPPGPPVPVGSPPNATTDSIAAGGSLELGAASSVNVAFAGATGSLQLDASQSFTGTVTGFGGQDQIDLADIAFGTETTLGFGVAYDNSHGTLSVSDGTHTANIALLGQYTAASFAAASDGHGGTLITDPSPVQQPQQLAQPH
jgi:hypothetical protein